jgi:hypothetical protein
MGLWTNERAPVHGSMVDRSGYPLHDDGVTGESPERRFGGRGLTERGLGEGGDDGEAIFGIGKARGGRGQAHDDEESTTTLAVGGGEWGEGEELWEGRMRCGMLWGSSGRLL